MSPYEAIPTRAARLHDQLDAPLAAAWRAHGEIVDRLTRIDRFVDAMPDRPSPHPLGPDPAQTTEILFHLDRCETMLEQCPHQLPAISLDRLRHVGLRAGCARRLLAWGQYLRARRANVTVQYDPPTLREIVFLKAPRLLAPLLAVLLPKTRAPIHFQGRRKETPDEPPIETAVVAEVEPEAAPAARRAA
jgi:hypothetical protein